MHSDTAIDLQLNRLRRGTVNFAMGVRVRGTILESMLQGTETKEARSAADFLGVDAANQSG
jgi:hypothetical protein